MTGFKLAEIYTDGMIFQRRKPIVLMGEALRDGILYAELDGVKVSQNIQKGRFRLTLPSREAGRELVLRVWMEGECVTLCHICCGEVWVAGGQSNMAFELRESAEYKGGMTVVENPDIRLYSVGQNALNSPNREGFAYSYDYRERQGARGLPILPILGLRGEL